jgi:uncharacterized protein (DUF924 family)
MSVPLLADADYRDVLSFWFGDGSEDARSIARNNTRWWQANSSFDTEIAKRFGGLREDAIGGELDHWLDSAHGRLVLIILVDQFSRNMYRKQPRAFMHDALARQWCEEGLKANADDALSAIERVFFYMPLQHSESIADQDLSVMLFRLLRDSVGDAQRDTFANFLRHAERHRAVVARFGRFPHRNIALGRESSAEELAFLEQPGSSF